jgi:hypothetical protein
MANLTALKQAMAMKNSDITLHLTLSRETAIGLYRFLNAANHEHYKNIIGNEKDAFLMTSASHAVLAALINQGHTKRV